MMPIERVSKVRFNPRFISDRYPLDRQRIVSMLTPAVHTPRARSGGSQVKTDACIRKGIYAPIADGPHIAGRGSINIRDHALNREKQRRRPGKPSDEQKQSGGQQQNAAQQP
jgi:hypothetical protein